MLPHLGATEFGAATPTTGHARACRAAAAVRFGVAHEISVDGGQGVRRRIPRGFARKPAGTDTKE
jgi:hypothetical protein